MKNKLLLLTILLSLFTILICQQASAITYVSNSADWKDVYSLMLYGGLKQSNVLFITSDKQALLLPNDMGIGDDIIIFSSTTRPYINGYKTILEADGFRNVTEEKYANINLELADRSGMRNFIIIDPAYGHNAISVSSYALVTDSYVIFATRDNIRDIERFLQRKGPQKVLIYGNVQREVRSALAPYEPEVINENGDKFLNNIEMVKKTIELTGVQQVVMTNGEFLEQEIITSRQPILFTGKSSVPVQVADYIKSSDIKVGVLIGNELIRSAQTIRRQTGISTIVKFGRDARAPSAGMGQVEALDMFYLPAINIRVVADVLSYNIATNSLEVTLKNEGDVAAYVKGTYTLTDSEEFISVGDEDTVFIDAGESKTFTYLTGKRLTADTIPTDIFILFGESKYSLEYAYEEKGYNARVIEVDDSSEISLIDVYYNEQKDAFIIEVTNNGQDTTFVAAEVVDISINNQLLTIAGDNIAELGRGENTKLQIAANLTEDDFANNNEILIRLYYGEREDALVKVLDTRKPLVVKAGIDVAQYAAYAAIVVLLILIITSRKKCKHCGKHNPRKRSECKHCGGKLK